MGLIFDYAEGQTPLDDDERDGLLVTAIGTRKELDEFELENIETALEWTLRRHFKQSQILSEQFVRTLHKRMFGKVWAWAGKFRKTHKNLGVDAFHIGVSLKTLLDDTSYWVNHQSFDPDEIAVRFKHRIVSIHCFSNGNGRHSRLMADIIVTHIFNKPPFTWGAAGLLKPGYARASYIKALRAADLGDYTLLVHFARS